MSRPFFTIAIPTKNRPDRLRNAIRSVLSQTFSDLELIVCDNSDEAADTAAIVREFDDPRLHYIRTSGRLSMPDNWERSIADARGEFVGILTDRSVFRRDALQIVHFEIDRTGARFVSWFQDHFSRDTKSKGFRRRSCTLKRYEFDRDRILSYFVNGDPKFAPKILPKLMTSVCHRSVFDRIRASTIARCCPPVCPDYTSGFLMLAYCDSVLIIDDALYVSCGIGNGFEFRQRSELATQFLRDLGMNWTELTDRMPSDACFSHALTLNDLMRLRDMLPEMFPRIEINRVQYYLGCLYDFVKSARHNADRREDAQILLKSLNNEAEDVQSKVRSTSLYSRAIEELESTATTASETDDTVDAPAADRFETVFEALAWCEANPLDPASTSFLDILPKAEDMLRKPRRRQNGLGSIRQSLKRTKKVARRGLNSIKRVARRTLSSIRNVARHLPARMLPQSFNSTPESLGEISPASRATHPARSENTPMAP